MKAAAHWQEQPLPASWCWPASLVGFSENTIKLHSCFTERSCKMKLGLKPVVRLCQHPRWIHLLLLPYLWLRAVDPTMLIARHMEGHASRIMWKHMGAPVVQEQLSPAILQWKWQPGITITKSVHTALGRWLTIAKGPAGSTISLYPMCLWLCSALCTNAGRDRKL